MFDTALYRRVALAVALVALALSGASTGAAVDTGATETTDVSAPVSTADASVTETVNVTFVYDGDRLVLGNAENATVRVRTDAEQGRELTVMMQTDQFVRTTPAVVEKNGNATATFDLSDVESGTQITVRASPGDAEITGRVVNESGVLSVYTTADAAVNATFVHEGDRPVLRTAENQTLRLRTDAEPGRELTVRIKTDAFLRTTTAVVGEDGTATATFDLHDVAAGKEFRASVAAPTSAETEVEGLLVNESATVHRDATFAVTDPNEEFRIRGRVADPTVTKLDVRYASEGATHSGSQTIAVGDEGSFAATFDLSSVDAGGEVSVEVGGLPRKVEEVVVTDESGTPTVYAFVETPLQLAIQRPEGEVLVHPEANQTVRGVTNLRPGTEVVVTAENSAVNVPSDFSLSETATVGEDGTFAATMNFSEAEAGTNFTVAVERGLTLAEVEGRVVDSSVEIPTASVGDGESVPIGEWLAVAQAENRRVTVETDASPGEEVTVVAKASGQFLRTDVATVAENGTVTASFDFSEVAAGTEFTVGVRNDENPTPAVVVSDTATLDGEDPLTVRPGSNLTVRGETTADPGTRLVVGLTSDEFLRTETATVREDGTFAATFEFGDAEPGTEFEVKMVENATLKSGPVEGTVLAEETNESAFTTGTTTPDDGSDGHVDEFGVPGFGVPATLVALVALVAAPAFARRRQG